ncbi:MAG TPA: DUF3592 domain-containing protein [Thermoanaerobaculia bacterium]|jgi:hypothetical protein
MLTQPLSNRRAGPSTGCLVMFFLVFLLTGGIVSVFTFVLPTAGYLAARSWTQTECDVLESRVAESTDSDSTTYRPEIVYTYSAGGRTYRSDRYDFFGVWSSGRKGKEEIVARYPPGARVTCWFDPANPEEAVLSRELGLLHLLGLLPLIFVFVGLGGLVWTVRAGRRARALAAAPVAAGSASPFGVAPPPGAGLGPLELRSTLSPLGKLLGLGFAAVFWNGIVSVFVWQAVAAWKSGQPDGCLTVFLIPFVLIGIGLVYGVFRQLLVLFNPRPYLTLSPGILAPGESTYLQWRLEGSSGRVRRLRIVLEGREEARYRRGTDTCTDRETFASVSVLDTTQPFEIATGSTGFSVPAGTMPSFSAENNKVVWSLKVQCEIPGWPDSEEEYEVLVRPAGAGGGA